MLTVMLQGTGTDGAVSSLQYHSQDGWELMDVDCGAAGGSETVPRCESSAV